MLTGVMNIKVEREAMDGVLEKWRVLAAADENRSALLDVYAGRELMVVNAFFQHKMTHRYSWRVERGREEEGEVGKALIDYTSICVDEQIRGQVMAARVFRGVGYGLPGSWCEN